jgi:hypothetical protein
VTAVTRKLPHAVPTISADAVMTAHAAMSALFGHLVAVPTLSGLTHQGTAVIH